MVNANLKILFPIKIDATPSCILVGDNVVIDKVITPNSIVLSTSRCKLSAEINPSRRNAVILSSYLTYGPLYGKVFAQFINHLLIEAEVQSHWFQVCNYRNSQVPENQLND